MTCSSAINECLIALMCERVKSECAKMHNAGASTEDINACLSEHILPHYELWRQRFRRSRQGETERAPVESENARPAREGTSSIEREASTIDQLAARSAQARPTAHDAADQPGPVGRSIIGGGRDECRF